MTPKLNLQKLTSNMSVEDKAKILMTDGDVYAENHGYKGLLSSAEREKIYQDAIKSGQLKALNKILEYSRWALLICLDLEKRFLYFVIELSELDRHISCSYVKGVAEDEFMEMAYTYVSKVHSSLEEPIRQETINAEVDSLFSKSEFAHGILDTFDYLDKSVESDSVPEGAQVYVRPNKKIMKCVRDIRQVLTIYIKAKRELEIICERAGMQVIPEMYRTQTVDHQVFIDTLIGLQGRYSFFKIYLFSDIQISPDDAEAQDFINSLKTIDSWMQLSDAELVECEKAVDHYFDI